jgi:hypothetical protein
MDLPYQVLNIHMVEAQAMLANELTNGYPLA